MHFDERQRKAADAIARLEPGQSLKSALISAGYSENVAKQGWDAIPMRVLKLLAKKGVRFVQLGEIDAATQEKLVRGRLVYNTIKGSDKGVLSAKALGSDRRVNMFTPENQTGIIVIGSPTAGMEDRAKKLLENKDAETNS